MARPQSRYVCQACATSHLRWEGQCRGCGAWDTLVETVVRDAPGRSPRPLDRRRCVYLERRTTPPPSVDRVP